MLSLWKRNAKRGPGGLLLYISKSIVGVELCLKQCDAVRHIWIKLNSIYFKLVNDNYLYIAYAEGSSRWDLLDTGTFERVGDTMA